jgi:GH43 family beta-xylosidase
MNKLKWLTLTMILLVQAASAQTKTFTNPILPTGPDPWVIYKDGYYYYTNSTGENLVIWKTKSVVDLKNALRTVVWTPPTGTSYSKELWAPELHYLQHKWYMYFAADDGDNDHHRLYVIENASQGPNTGRMGF